MTRTAGEIVEQAHLILQDDGTRWSPATLFKWIDEAQRFIAKVVPEAYARTTTHTLSSGAEQQLPANATFLFRIVRDNTGRVPRVAVKRALDALDPAWQSMAAQAEVRQYMLDEYEHRRFWVFPPNTGTGVVIEYQAKPSSVTDASSLLDCPDNFFTAVLDYVLYRAFDMDAEESANRELSQMHLVRASEHLGISPRAALNAVRKEQDHG